jgi:hypothetical protein
MRETRHRRRQGQDQRKGKINCNGKTNCNDEIDCTGKSNSIQLLRQSIGSLRGHPAAQMAH